MWRRTAKKWSVATVLATLAVAACATAPDETTEPIGFCLSEKLFVSGIWLTDPVFGAPQSTVETYPDGSTGEFEVVDVRGGSGDERAPSASAAAIVDASVPTGFSAVLADARSSSGPDSAFVVSHVSGFNLGGMLDVVDGRILGWTGCSSEWVDYTDVLAEWARSEDTAKIVEAMKAIVRLSRTDGGYDERGALTERLWDIGMRASIER